MTGRGIAVSLVFGAAFFLSVPFASPESTKAGSPQSRPGRDGFVGSEKCAPCHQIQYKGWVNTFHSTVIKDAKKDPGVILADLTAPDIPFKKEEIYYTIGGHWDQRYLTRIGDDFYVLPRLWSIQGKKWRPYSTYGWQKRPYSKFCVGCHAVGFEPQEKTYVEHAVGCESCHGQGEEHVKKPEKSNIVNPRKLPKARAEEICASCHVRGMDLSGGYHFPIGYTAGDDLSKLLIPLDKMEGESNSAAIHRLWDKWKEDREAKARSRCEVCGIFQTEKPKGEKRNVDAACMNCHDFGENLPQHTRHKPETKIGCTDCHRQKKPELNEIKEKNVHSYGYFLVHPQGCWDREIHKRCGKCHEEKTEKWAYDTFMGWKKPVIVDH